MKALSGTMGERTREVLTAGCDLALHCNGEMVEMKAVAQNSPPLEAMAAERFAAVQKLVHDAAQSSAQLNNQQAEARYQHIWQWFAE